MHQFQSITVLVRIMNLNGSTHTYPTSIFTDKNAAKHFEYILDKSVTVPANKAPNNIFFCASK